MKAGLCAEDRVGQDFARALQRSLARQSLSETHGTMRRTGVKHRLARALQRSLARPNDSETHGFRRSSCGKSSCLPPRETPVSRPLPGSTLVLEAQDKTNPLGGGLFYCAEDQGRTGDLPLFRRALYQLSYLGKRKTLIN